MNRQFTPEQIRDIGDRACPAIADSYDEIAPWVRWADGYKDRAFGTHPNREIWTSLFELFKIAVTETPISVNAMGRALVEVANSYDEDEQHTVADLDGLLDDLEADFDRNRETIFDERAEEEEERTREEARRAIGAEQAI